MTGARRGEALGLSWGDLDLDTGTAMIRHAVIAIAGRIEESTTKSGEPRKLHLRPSTVAALSAWKATQAQELLAQGRPDTDDLVFTAQVGREADTPLRRWALHPNTVSQAFRGAAKRGGLPLTTRLHDLRHAFATSALELGIHPKIVQETLGHSSIQVTLGIYSHVTAAVERRAVDAVGALYEAASDDG